MRRLEHPQPVVAVGMSGPDWHPTGIVQGKDCREVWLIERVDVRLDKAGWFLEQLQAGVLLGRDSQVFLRWRFGLPFWAGMSELEQFSIAVQLQLGHALNHYDSLRPPVSVPHPFHRGQPPVAEVFRYPDYDYSLLRKD